MDATSLMILLAFVPSAAFPIVYAFTAKWYSSIIGRSLMWMSVSVSMVLALVVLATFLGPDFPGRQAIRFVIYSLVASAMWPLLISYSLTVYRIRKKGQSRNEDVENG